MCGLVAVVARQGHARLVDQALEAIRHRGPDAHGTFEAERKDCVLGHNRLAIIDTSDSGVQPMHDQSGRYVIVYNGEIYNYAELRNELDRSSGGIAWSSHSDTEVLIEGYAREGEAFFDKLNGMFAFILYDKKTGETLVLRDPLGIKPLLIHQEQGRTIFASEISAVRALALGGLQVREESLADQLSLSYVPEPYTMYRDVYKFPPGELKKYRDGVEISSRRLFRHLEGAPFAGDLNAAVEEFGAAFRQAIKRQMRSDVPVALLLSGGLDSTAIALEAANQQADLKRAFTMSFPADDLAHHGQSDDLSAATTIASGLGLPLEHVAVSGGLMEKLSAFNTLFDEGVSDPAAIATFLMCRAARDANIKVVLTGHGADEFWGGYRRYQAHSLLSHFPTMAPKLLGAVERLSPRLRPGPLNAGLRRLRRLAQIAAPGAGRTLEKYYTWVPDDLITSVFRHPLDSVPSQRLAAEFNAMQADHPINAMMKIDQRFDLMSLNLNYGDRMSMASSVEMRVPFLDFDLVRLANSLPPQYKVTSFNSKIIIRKFLKGRMPSSIVHRSKAGLNMPVNAWMSEKVGFFDSVVNERTVNRYGILKWPEVQSVISRGRSGQNDYQYLMFSIMLMHSWLENRV